ncbi:peptidoglycan bridge formation glycyltransferase FemA/FemB family protein [Candidatus Peregrinibacteria bacterium]|nr:peptidoglycan bridge formation glycyltransferase FemA/FemB family protein [Candidatus Peregrinibacteria bacterium]
MNVSHFEELNYEKTVKRHPAGTLFQSLAFGEFQKTIPYRSKFWVLETKEKDAPFGRSNAVGRPSLGTASGLSLPTPRLGLGEASCLVIKIKLPLGFSWLWVPFGPLGFKEEIFEDLKRLAAEEKAIFARIEPPASWNQSWTSELKKNFKICNAPHRFTPEHTLVLNIEGSEEEILAQMKPKGRYNIGVAVRKGVHVRMFKKFEDVPQKDFDEFYEILKTTAARDEFGIHPCSFYENFLKTLGQENMSALFLAYEPETKKVTAGLIATFYKDTAIYYYGASSGADRNLMAPYLLQWEAILEAKKRDLKFYDFLGIAPADDSNHPWKGVTEFKKKFGGKEIKYPPAFDIVYKKTLYGLLRLPRR